MNVKGNSKVLATAVPRMPQTIAMNMSTRQNCSTIFVLVKLANSQMKPSEAKGSNAQKAGEGFNDASRALRLQLRYTLTGTISKPCENGPVIHILNIETAVVQYRRTSRNREQPRTMQPPRQQLAQAGVASPTAREAPSSCQLVAVLDGLSSPFLFLMSIQKGELHSETE
jgi:hypothetical protein